MLFAGIILKCVSTIIAIAIFLVVAYVALLLFLGGVCFCIRLWPVTLLVLAVWIFGGKGDDEREAHDVQELREKQMQSLAESARGLRLSRSARLLGRRVFPALAEADVPDRPQGTSQSPCLAQETSRLAQEAESEAKREEKLRGFAMRESPRLWKAYQEIDAEVAVRERKLEELRQTLRDFGRDPGDDADVRRIAAGLVGLKGKRSSFHREIVEAYLQSRKFEVSMKTRKENLQ